MPTTRPGRPYVVAVDSGGTRTRVACVDLEGRRLSGATGPAGAWHHDDDAVAHLQETVLEALRSGDLAREDARALVAGVAGVSRRGGDHGDRSLEWARSAYALPELACPQVVVNDAVTAHRGALAGEPGVVVVAGTGSMVLAITADGDEVENGQLAHYAGGARHLAFEAVQQVLVGAAGPDDADLVAALLAAWGAADVAGLRTAALEVDRAGRHAVTRRYGALAPLVTAAASTSPLADRAVRALAERTARGVLLLAPLVGRGPVRVSTTGAVASDPAFRARLREVLVVPGAAPTLLVPPAGDAVLGAVIMALELAGEARPGALDRLHDDPP
ncbi:BadF/BadG/BcrA/BcrD ATPase family protein [Pseudokineococcus sp. 5B2Z-1]|uniref:BadF/BadG/BcrA/BcrD ATPase family protein n=1 Tax=Pseudokineococcus sp. 5B2Z-1 TaxID=3132744 RepID=UPI0030A55A3E